MFFRYIVFFLIAVLFSVSGCSRKMNLRTKLEDNKIQIAAGIPPVADFCRRIGGDKVNVRLLVPAGASPHIYQPSSDDMRYLTKADFLVLNGIGIEFWADSLVSAAHNSKLVVIDLSKEPGIADSIMQDNPNNHQQNDSTGNPHVWLDPNLVKIQAEAICSELSKQYPAYADLFENNLQAFELELDELDQNIRDQFSNIRSRDFITFHPAWTYFAKRYNLNEVAAIEEFPGKEPTSDNLKYIIGQVKRLNIKAIFAEPQFSTQLAETIAQDAGAKVIIIDPLAAGSDWDYIKMMNTAVNKMAEALK